jgi:hypothetical protein
MVKKLYLKKKKPNKKQTNKHKHLQMSDMNLHGR